MKKYLAWVPVLFVILAGCASTPPKPAAEAPKVVAPKFVIVDHKNAVWGKDAPDWVLKDQTQLEQEAGFKGNYVFKFEESGKDLDAVKIWANSFSAQPAISRIVTTRVQDKFVGAAAGDKDKVETYMEQVVKVLSDAEYTGYKKWEDYWVLKSFLNDKGQEDRREYMYVMVYTMPKDVLDALVKRALESANLKEKPKSEDEKTARERVKEAFNSGL